MRRSTTALVLSTIMLLLGGLLSAAPSKADSPILRSITVRPGDDLQALLSAARPGDYYNLEPGTYDITGDGGGGLRPLVPGSAKAGRPTMPQGTAAHPIIVSAANASAPPLLRGWMMLYNPVHWTFQYLRVQTVQTGRSAVYVSGGTAFSLRKSEFFGANGTGAFANVAIASDAHFGNPTHWQFVDNCVHDAGRGTLAGHNPDTDHNLYVSASGNAPGLIARNVMYNATAGYNIKIGNGDGSSPGASNVHVLFNELSNARRQVLVLGRVSGDVLTYNIMWHSTRPSLPSGTVFYNLAVRGGVTISHTWNYQTKPAWYAYPQATTAYVRDGGDNGVHAGNAGLSGTCNPTLAVAAVGAKYGPTSALSWMASVP